MIQNPQNPTHIPYGVLPESRDWRPGKTYRVKAVVKQTGSNEDGADFEIVDATSLESSDSSNRRKYFLSDGGSYRA